MACRLIWTPKAQDDLRHIAEYIERDSLFYAKTVVKKVYYEAEKLRNLSYKGRIIPEFEQETMREIFVYNFRVLYQIELETINILAVIHGKQLLKTHFSQQENSSKENHENYYES